jgi:hypothetical protein
MKAEEARRLTEEALSIRGEHLRGLTAEVLGLIGKAARKGERSIGTVHTDPVIQSRLKELGYTVKYQGDQRPGDGPYMTVSW